MPLKKVHIISPKAALYCWLVFLLWAGINSLSSAQDREPVNNRRQTDQTQSKSTRKKERPFSNKKVAGKRLTTRNKNSRAQRAFYSNPTVDASRNNKAGDRAGKPVRGSRRIQSNSAENARNNVYPSSGGFSRTASTSSESGNPPRSRFTRSGNLSSRPIKSGNARYTPPRTRSTSAENSRSKSFGQRGSFVNRGASSGARITQTYTRKVQSRSTSSESRGGRGTGNFSRSGNLSASGRAKSTTTFTRKIQSRSSSSESRGGRSSRGVARRGNMSTNASIKNPFTRKPQSRSASAETSRNKRYQQSGRFVNRSSRNTARVFNSRGTTRGGAISAGPVSTGRKKKTVTPRSASQQFVTKGKKNVYWGKFSKGEKPFTTDISGNPLRRRNYQTPRNEVSPTKNPYEGRKQSKGDKAYSGTFKSGHVSRSRQTEKAWIGDISGHAIRKRPLRQNESVGRQTKSLKSTGGGSISASAKYRSNTPLSGRMGNLSITGRLKANARKSSSRPAGGGSISASGRYRSNAPLNGRMGNLSITERLKANSRKSSNRLAGGGSISASGKYRSNAPINRRMGNLSITEKLKANARKAGTRTAGGGSISASGKYRSNAPLSGRMGGLSITARLKEDARRNVRRPNGGGSISASGRYRSNNPLARKTPGIGVTSMSRSFGMKGIKPEKGGGSISAEAWYRSNKPITRREPGIGASSMSRSFAMKGIKPKKGGGGSISASGKYRSNEPIKRGIANSISGRLLNNDNKPIPVRQPGIGGAAVKKYQNRIGGVGDMAKDGRYRKGTLSVSGQFANNEPLRKADLATGEGKSLGKARIKKHYEQNPNANKLSLKKESPDKTVFMADGIQVGVKAKDTGKKPKAVKGSMPGLSPSKATVKASEYNRSLKMYWSYKHNPSSVDAAQKTIAPSRAFYKASDYSGRTRLTKNYRHNPNSDKSSLKVLAPGRAYARITDYQGNVKMKKYNDKKFLPDSRFAHNRDNNVKNERTINTNLKLLWTKLFKKNGTQPEAVKAKSHKPRYDKKERELWLPLYD